jgi:hypothetical protein
MILGIVFALQQSQKLAFLGGHAAILRHSPVHRTPVPSEVPGILFGHGPYIPHLFLTISFKG